MKRIMVVIVIVATVLVIAGGHISASDYRIGPEDVLEISFWQDTDLNSVVRVGLDGRISVDIAGEIMAAGKTTEELQGEIVRKISRLNTRISQSVVRVIEFNYQHVFVTGHVNEPGKKTFEEIPDLLTIISEAGWITEVGDLSRVTIIRGGEKAGQVEVVDVADAIADSALERLPQIKRQDAIDIPSTPAGIPGVDLGRQQDGENVVYVIGAVNTPGPIRFNSNLDILEAMSKANGPTDNADLEKVRVITKDGYYGQSIQLDLNKYTKTGTPARYILYKEDIFIVPTRREGFLRENTGTIVAILGAVTSAMLIYETLKPQEEEALTP
ncbi:MAG: polysaccharide biosynthesis/export family protein [candidate division Zixibacteria bacterium]|nr:polysaccharide biosynthesis/export family protein [candidate division Zixibacteria bacterium]